MTEMTPSEVVRKLDSFFKRLKACLDDDYYELYKRFDQREYSGVEDVVSRYIRMKDEWFDPSNLTILRRTFDSVGAFNRELNRRLDNRARLKVIIEEWRTFVHSFPGGYWDMETLVRKHEKRR